MTTKFRIITASIFLVLALASFSTGQPFIGGLLTSCGGIQVVHEYLDRRAKR